MIEPRADAYGKEADGSALADYLELLALSEASITQAGLADLIADNGWRVRSRELFQAVPPATGEVEDEPAEDTIDRDLNEHPSAEAARTVFDILAERSELLTDEYPFILSGPRLIARAPARAEDDRYLTLLAITAAHAYDVDTSIDPRKLFEATIAQVMGSRQLLTVNMGEIGRQATDFAQALTFAANGLQLRAAPDAAPRRTYANEAGVDTLSHLCWGDQRAGHWLLIGQATCGKSETWGRKILEPTPDNWGPWMGSLVSPIPYLAVPHHVEAHHLYTLTSDHRRLILDRLRLCPHLNEVSAEQRTIMQDVRSTDIARP